MRHSLLAISVLIFISSTPSVAQNSDLEGDFKLSVATAMMCTRLEVSKLIPSKEDAGTISSVAIRKCSKEIKQLVDIGSKYFSKKENIPNTAEFYDRYRSVVMDNIRDDAVEYAVTVKARRAD